jgi:hypothetical protein
MTTPTPVPTFQCEVHGEMEWKLTLVCGDCHRIYQAVAGPDEFVPVCPGATRAPVICECGANLPKRSARKFCTPCFVEATEKVIADAEAAKRGALH